MPAPKPRLSRPEFDALVARAGLPLDEARRSEFYAVFGYVEAMADRVRAGGNRRREAEPALTFRPLSKPAE